jgi:hypothetical protein
VARTIHQLQSLSLDEMTFNSNGINKHGLVYTALSRIRIKEKLYLLYPLTISKFQVDKAVYLEMKRLSTITKWKLSNYQY